MAQTKIVWAEAPIKQRALTQRTHNIVNQPQVKVNHDELIRDYAGYEFIQDEMEALVKQFLQVYYQDILKLYGFPEPQNTETLEVMAAGAGASKFVFGAIDKQANLTLGIRLYNSKGFMKDCDKTYESADEYRVNLETHDKPLTEALVDETRIYEELEKNAAKTGIDVRGTWAKFPIHKDNYKNTEYGQYIEDFIYIEDRELKRLMVNLGINAFTIGGFVIGYDGRKVLERPEFGPQDKLNAIIHICNTMLQSWLFTVRHNHKLVGRTIVDLKPAQFVLSQRCLLHEETYTGFCGRNVKKTRPIRTRQAKSQAISLRRDYQLPDSVQTNRCQTKNDSTQRI